MEISVCGYLLVLCFVNALRFCQSINKVQSIWGGEYADIKNYPHVVFIAMSCQTWNTIEQYTCGSSILNHRVLMTAAHCMENCLPSSHVTAYVGSGIKEKGTKYSGKKFKRHPEFIGGDGLINDIALIYLAKSLKFKNNVKKIALMQNSPKDETGEVAGWGLGNDMQRDTYQLKFALQKVLSKKKCVEILKYLYDGTFCTNGSHSKKIKFGHPKQGDSGSALVVRGYIAIGVVSSYVQSRIGSIQSVTIYTDTTYYINWIRKTSRELYCEK